MIKIILIVILSVVAFVLVLVGVGFFISSLYFYLLNAFHNPAIAASFCGLGLLLLAIFLLLIVLLIKSSLFKWKKPARLKAQFQAVREDPAGETLQLIKKYPFRSVAAAVASGFALGFFPKLRNSLIDGVATYINTGSLADSLKSMKTTEDDEES
jgi:hypothetical protein